MKKNQNGFGVVEGLLILVIVGIIGGTGWYVWHANSNANKSLDNAASTSLSTLKPKAKTIKTFDDCKKAPSSKILATLPEQCATKDGKKFTNYSQATAPYESTFSKVPAELQNAIVAQNAKDAPACVKNGQLVDSSDRTVFYAPENSALAGIGCDGGSQGLFVKETNGLWKFLAKTQQVYDCDLLTDNHIPKALLALNTDSPQCFDKASDNLKPYNG